ncbi:MAG: redoxin family protein [Pseudomonadota bacterium]
MQQWTKTGAAVALTAWAALAAAGSAVAGEFNKVVSIGDSMPEFTNLPTAGGGQISSADITEDVVVLVSLANHCPWVKGMDADMVKLASSFGGKSVRFVGLSFNHREDDRLPAMKTHAEKAGYPFKYAFDESQELGRALGATRTPEYFVFDSDRKLVYTGALYNSPAKIQSDGSVKYTRGEPTEFFVQDAVMATLAGDAVTLAETKAHGCTVKYQ